MIDEQQSSNTQINLATVQRNAGRDYHEYFMPSSIKLFLATQTKDTLDRIALDNSRFFRYRFGFEPSRVVRQQVLDIQNKYDLTDREMRELRHSGQLQFTHTEAKLAPARWLPYAGWIQLAFLSLICTSMVVSIAYSKAPPLKLLFVQTFVAASWFGGALVLKYLYIAPWRILKRSGAISATAL